MTPTRHLHPHAANTTTAQLRPDCCTAVARLLHGHCTTSAWLLHRFCTTSARLLQRFCKAPEDLRLMPFPSCPRHRYHAQNTQIPNPHASRTTKCRLNRAIARWARPGYAETTQVRADQPKPNLPEPNRNEPNKLCPGQSGPITIIPGTIKPAPFARTGSRQNRPRYRCRTKQHHAL